LDVKAKEIIENTELEIIKTRYEEELAFKKKMKEIEIERVKEISKIEASKQTQVINAIGKKTLVEMARAGPETQAKLLKGLGLKSYMITDGSKPVNLMNTATGLLGSMG
jgi:major vault protein